MGMNGPWRYLGSVIRAFKKQKKVITKRGYEAVGISGKKLHLT